MFPVISALHVSLLSHELHNNVLKLFGTIIVVDVDSLFHCLCSISMSRSVQARQAVCYQPMRLSINM